MLNEHEWWVNGVPIPIQLKCQEEWTRKKRKGTEASYLSLIHYQDIALQNWELFRDAFTMDEKDIGNRQKCVAWVKRLNDIRNVTHHPEKGLLDAQEMDFVNRTAEQVFRHFAEPTSSDE